MIRKTLSQRAFPAALALVALAALVTVPAAAGELVCRASTDHCAEVNGAYAPDARFFATGSTSRFLVDLPSLSMSVLINTKSGKAIAVPRSSLKRETEDGVVSVALPIPPDSPAYVLSIDGQVVRFQVDDSEVRILRSSACQPTVTPVWNIPPVTDDSSARRCLQQESRPLAGAFDCTKGAYLKNSCEVPVVAVVQTTQHLFSGDLAETSSIVLPPGVAHSLGCTWSKGAMAPSEFDLRAASFLPKKPAAESRDHGSAKP